MRFFIYILTYYYTGILHKVRRDPLFSRQFFNELRLSDTVVGFIGIKYKPQPKGSSMRLAGALI